MRNFCEERHNPDGITPQEGRFFDLIVDALAQQGDDPHSVTLTLSTTEKIGFKYRMSVTRAGQVNSQTPISYTTGEFNLLQNPHEHKRPVLVEPPYNASENNGGKLPNSALRSLVVHKRTLKEKLESQYNNTKVKGIECDAMFEYAVKTGHLALHDGNHRTNSSTDMFAKLRKRDAPQDGLFSLNPNYYQQEHAGKCVVKDTDDQTLVHELLMLLKRHGIGNIRFSPQQLFAWRKP